MSKAKGFGAVGGAASGAATGFTLGGPIGAAVGGVAGLLGGFFGTADTPEYSLASVESLRSSNPELYNQLMQIKYMQAEAQRAADQKGINSAERIGMDDARSSLRSQQANRGLAGSSAAGQQQADLTNRLMAQQQQRAIGQEIARRQQAAQLSGQFLQQSHAILQPQATQKYAGAQAEAEGQNKFLSGLVNAGLNFYGNNEYMKNMPQTPGRAGAQVSEYTGGGVPSMQPLQPLQQNFGTAFPGPQYSSGPRQYSFGGN